MNEQLEQPIEGGTGEVLPEATVSPAGEETAEKTAEGPENSEGEVNTESSAEENNSDAELSASEDPDKPSPDGEGGSPQGLTDEVSPPAGGTSPPICFFKLSISSCFLVISLSGIRSRYSMIESVPSRLRLSNV